MKFLLMYFIELNNTAFKKSSSVETGKTPQRITESWPNLPEAAADFRFLLARGHRHH